MNWNAAPSTKIAPKITDPATIATTSMMPLATVQSTSRLARANPSTMPACSGRPIRRSANSSAAVWTKAGTGRIR